MKTVSDIEELAQTLALQYEGREWLLDEEVHEMHAAAAAEINNSGMELQIQYLLEQGMTQQEIVALLESNDEVKQ